MSSCGPTGNTRAVAALQDDVQTLRQLVKKLIDQAKAQSTTTGQLTAIVNSQSQLISLLQQQNQELQAKLGCMSKTGDDVYFTACNVHVVRPNDFNWAAGGLLESQ